MGIVRKSTLSFQKLCLIELSVELALFEERLMIADREELPPLQQDDLISKRDR